MDFHLVPRGTDRNYTGFFTKTIVYTGTLVIFLACERPPAPATMTTADLDSSRPDYSVHRHSKMGHLPE